MEALITTLVWAALLQGVLLAFTYLFSKRYPSKANRYLGFFLLVIVYEGILQYIPYSYIGDYPIFYFGLPVVKLFYPVLFFNYIIEKLGRAKKYRWFLRVHYFLAFSIWGLTLINLILFAFTGQNLAGHVGYDAEENIYMILQYYAVFIILIVFIISIIEVLAYSKTVREKYSDYEMLQINWLWGLILVLLPIIILWTIHLIYIATGNLSNGEFELAIWALVVVFLYFISYKAFKHRDLFEGEALNFRQDVVRKGVEKSAQELNSITDQEKLAIETIRKHMEIEEPYLDASLSIFGLARQLKMDVPQVSSLINHILGQHFFDFVNEYRIKRAQEILKDPDQVKKTVLEILYEVGFNSKSSFNTVFKKFTGMTPTEYRRSEN